MSPRPVSRLPRKHGAGCSSRRHAPSRSGQVHVTPCGFQIRVTGELLDRPDRRAAHGQVRAETVPQALGALKVKFASQHATTSQSRIGPRPRSCTGRCRWWWLASARASRKIIGPCGSLLCLCRVTRPYQSERSTVSACRRKSTPALGSRRLVDPASLPSRTARCVRGSIVSATLR